MISSLLRTTAIAVTAAITLWCSPAKAQFLGPGLCNVIDPLFGISPCSGLSSQLLQYARQAEQLLQEVTTAEQEVINTLALPGQIFADATEPIREVVRIAHRADLLIGNSRQFIGNLKAGYYPLPENAMAQLISEQNAIGNAIEQLGNVIGVVNPQLADRATILAAIQSESLGSVGRMQALQDANQLAATTGQDLHSLVVLTSAMAQGHHTTMLADRDRQAMEDAMMDQFSNNYTPYETTGWHGF